jgi:atypical dual specificity phosphatase
MAALKLAARRSLDAAGGDRAPARVAPGLFLGAAAAARNGRGLARRGVTHVLNASPAVPCHFRVAAPPGAAAPLRYLLLEDLFDDAEADLLRHVDAACAFIDAGRAAGGVLVHCFAGQSRSAALVMAYLIVRQGESLAGAWAAVRAARPAAAPNAGFLRQLAALEARLKGSRRGAGGGGSPRSMASSLAESLSLLELLPQ